MSNWKHTAAAFCAVVTVASLTAVQMSGMSAVMADKKEAQEREILAGDGVGETPDFPEIDDVALPEPTEEPVIEFEARTGYIVYPDGRVNVREAASKESQIKATLALGDSFTVSAQDGEWYAVTLQDGTNGYIMHDLVSFDYESIKNELLSSTMYETGTVSVSGNALNVRNVPSETDSVVIDQISNGEKVYVIEKNDAGWYKVYFGKDYDIGYVKADYIIIGDMIQRDTVAQARKDRLNSAAKKGTVVTGSNYVNVRSAPSENAEIVSTLKNGENCTIISQGSKWTKILTGSGIAYVISSAVMDEKALADYQAALAASVVRTENAQKNSEKPASAKKASAPAAAAAPAASGGSVSGSKIVKEAEKYIGTKYVYGGSSPAGFDCSGLVQYTMKKVGISVGRSSRDQYKNGTAVSKSDLQAGDLVFFSKGGSISHVGIYAGGGKVIHSPKPGQSVCYTTLDKMCSYSTYVGARRVS